MDSELVGGVSYPTPGSSTPQLCKSDLLWEQIVQNTCDTITPDMRALAKEVGWRQMFFTTKIQLQRQVFRKRQKQRQGKQKEKKSL